MVSLLALAAGIFVAQTAEFLPGGLVPHIADDLAVEVAAVGQMVSVFAFTVVVATTPLALFTRRIGRKLLVVASLAGVSVGNLAVALAPSLEWIFAARVFGAIAHGLFWAVVATYAVEIVPREKLGRAMAITAAGGSLAGILGIPIGNALGELFGWRYAFVVVAAAGAAVTVILLLWLPPIEGRTIPTSAPARQTRWDSTALGVLMICALILILVIGQTTLGPYTAVWLEQEAGLERAHIPAYLLITGVAGAVGALVAGHLYDRHPRSTFLVSCALLALALCAFPIAAAGGFSLSLVAVAVASSVAFAGLPTMLQTRMMHTASPAMRRVAGAVQTTVFNIAIGSGALLGGIVVTTLGVQALPWIAAGGAFLTGVLAVAWEVRRAAQSRRASDQSNSHLCGAEAA